MDHQQVLVVVGAVENEKGELLLSQRYEPTNPQVHLNWEFPGGTNHFGESLEETLKRELKEEVGIEVEIGELMAKSVSYVMASPDRNVHVVILCFRCRWLSGEAKPCEEEVNDVRWVAREDLASYHFFPTMQGCVDQL